MQKKRMAHRLRCIAAAGGIFVSAACGGSDRWQSDEDDGAGDAGDGDASTYGDTNDDEPCVQLDVPLEGLAPGTCDSLWGAGDLCDGMEFCVPEEQTVIDKTGVLKCVGSPPDRCQPEPGDPLVLGFSDMHAGVVFEFSSDVVGNYSTEGFKDAFERLRVGNTFPAYDGAGEVVVCSLDQLDYFEYEDGRLKGALEYVVSEVGVQVYSDSCSGIDCRCELHGLAVPVHLTFDLFVEEPG